MMNENKMKIEVVHKNYFDNNYNCAETILRTADECYNFNLSDDALKIIGGFGGGMGCGKTCGALCASLAVISQKEIKTKAHETENFRADCAKLVKEFKNKLGSTECSELKAKYFQKNENRCCKTVELAAEVLEDFIKDNNI